MKRMIHRKKPVCCLAGATGLIFLLLFLALWLERLWSGSSHSLPTVVSLWQGVLFLVYFLIVCGSVCCRSMGRTRRWSGFLRYLPWAAAMTLLFTPCLLTEWLTFSDVLLMALFYLPQPLTAGGVLIFLTHRLCPEQEGAAAAPRKQPVHDLIGVTVLISLLLLFAFWLERLGGSAFRFNMTMASMLWDVAILSAYLLIVCGSICCWSICKYRCRSGFLRYLPWAAVMTLLFLLCAFSGSPSAPGWPELILSYLPQPLIAGGMVIFLAHCLCPEREAPHSLTHCIESQCTCFQNKI